MPIGRFNHNNRESDRGNGWANGGTGFLQGPSLLQGRLQQFIQSEGEMPLPMQGLQGLLQRKGLLNRAPQPVKEMNTGNSDKELDTKIAEGNSNVLQGMKGLMGLFKGK